MIIWGTRGMTSTAQTGVFHCPRCGPQRSYALQRVRRWFTLYFIPLIPLDVAGEYIQCGQCAGTFSVEVLSYDPVAEQKKSLDQIKRILVLTVLGAGPPTESRVANLQQAIGELTDVHIAAEEIWAEFRLAQDAHAQLVPYVTPLAPQFSEDGKRKILGCAVIALSNAGRLDALEKDVLRQLGTSLGLARALVDAFLERIGTAS